MATAVAPRGQIRVVGIKAFATTSDDQIFVGDFPHLETALSEAARAETRLNAKGEEYQNKIHCYAFNEAGTDVSF